MPIQSTPMGSLCAEESTQLAGSLIALVASREGTHFAPSERYDTALRELGLTQARDMAVGKRGWSMETMALCDAMERQGLLYGDGMASYRITALGMQLGQEQGVAAAAPLAQAHPWVAPPPAPPLLSKLKSWIAGRRAEAEPEPEQGAKPGGPKA